MLENIDIFDNRQFVLQDTFDIIHPIGEIYTQYPLKKSPNELYNNDKVQSLWEEQLQYNGCFFRSENTLGSGSIIYSTDGVQFYKDSNLTQPISVKGLETPTHISGNQYRLTSTPGKANNFISSGSISKQGCQNAYHAHTSSHTHDLQSHIHTLSSHYHNVTSTNTEAYLEFKIPNRDGGQKNTDINYGRSKMKDVNINVTVSGSTDGPSTNNTGGPSTDTQYSDPTSTDNVNPGGTEGRPDNYTIRIWRRIL